jgi:hypothetical protein
MLQTALEVSIMSNNRKGYSAVVESGSCSADRQRWEELRNCGHSHKTYEAANACGKRLAKERYVNGSRQANADWYYYKVHDQDGSRIAFCDL